VRPEPGPHDDAWDAARAGALADLLGPVRVFLNPDCGFGTFAERPVATEAVACRKLAILADAARRLRGGGTR